MRFRKLRIAWSVSWGLACVLLVVLWVRSYWHTYRFWGQAAGIESGIETDIGTVTVWRMDRSTLGHADFPWRLDKVYPAYVRPLIFEDPEFGFSITCPSFLLLVIILAVGGAPWVRRFSIRTLLIVTTLVAAVLGSFVWAVRG
jgi:hypothetical protein